MKEKKMGQGEMMMNEAKKSRIIYRLAGCRQDPELLERSVKRDVFGNLTAVLSLELMTDLPRGIRAERRITREDAARWGMKEEELWNYAWKNTPRRYPAVLRPLDEVLRELIRAQAKDTDQDLLERELLNDRRMQVNQKRPLYVLTNLMGVNGAAALLYPGILESAAKQIGGDLLILPSSIHEVLIQKWDGEIDLEVAAEMVKIINRQDVAPEEVLADCVYVYRKDSGKIECVRAKEE